VVDGPTWHDVGALLEAKRELERALVWPQRHAALLAGCPVRLRTGALLYGPSGCGKTLLARAAAVHCKLPIVVVKGAELLNKYIGASEQSVRDTFARAAALAPCVLFFDEFDALAPKRGVEHSGVSDRVVNQLLTQLDGVEALRDVFVLAATARPDLIDAALLRPGRLDRLVYCGVPTEEERFSILRTLTRRVALADDVDLRALARRTERMTGADLAALLTNACLATVPEHVVAPRTDVAGNVRDNEDSVDSAVKRAVHNAASSVHALGNNGASKASTAEATARVRVTLTAQHFDGELCFLCVCC
jgi:peroxin-1